MLEKVNSPKDLKKLNVKELNVLCGDIRELIINTCEKTGGHLASNLGAVELTAAIHYVFDIPADKLIFDVGHQCYAHKILTGRKEAFNTIRQDGGLSGFPKISESPFDCFDTGHSSNSLSVALGMARARDLNKEKHSVLALIGDGAMCGGMVYEALNDLSGSKSKVIILLNDNDMSISKSVGGLSLQLSKIRVSGKYQNLKKTTKKVLSKIPLLGKPLIFIIEGIKGFIVRTFLKQSLMFEKFGIKHVGPIDGHNLKALIKYLKKLKYSNVSCLAHIITQKGKGYETAEDNPEDYHSYNPEKNNFKEYSELLGEKLTNLAANDNKIVAVTAAMEKATGLYIFKKSYPDRFFDANLAEAHAVTMCAGLAAGGFKPYFAVYSTFLQRGFDQLITDAALRGLPVVFCIDRAGLASGDGETHHGIFDLSYLSMIPNIYIAVPKDINEFEKMLEFSVNFNRPLAIRYPRFSKFNFCESEIKDFGWEYLIKGNGGTVIISCGENMLKLAFDICNELSGQGVSLINARFLKPLDENTLLEIKDKNIITIEENVIKGGLGENISGFYASRGITAHLKIFGLDDAFIPHGNYSSLLSKYGINREEIVKRVR